MDDLTHAMRYLARHPLRSLRDTADCFLATDLGRALGELARHPLRSLRQTVEVMRGRG